MCYLQVVVPASLKATTKASLKCRKKISENLEFQAIFLKQKRRSATKKVEESDIDLASLYLVQPQIFWK